MQKSEVLSFNKDILTEIVPPVFMLNHINGRRTNLNNVLGTPITTGIIRPPYKAAFSKEIAEPGMLRETDLKEVIPHLFDTSFESVVATVNALSPGIEGKINELTVAKLEFGQIAYIFFCNASISNLSVPFVTYLSRGPKKKIIPGCGEPSLSGYATVDYTMLKQTLDLFKTRLPTDVRERFDVVGPIALGNFTYKGEDYTFYTMPFIPYGELNLSLQHFQGKNRTLVLPYFHYSIPWNIDMEKTNNNQHKDTRKRAEAYVQKNSEYDESSYSFGRQMTDLILGECLVHVVSNMIGMQHLIIAGDWMAVISPKGLRLKLITFRGPVGIMNKKKFIDMLLEHKEPLKVNIPNRESYDFSIFTDSGFGRPAIEEIYATAESMLLK